MMTQEAQLTFRADSLRQVQAHIGGYRIFMVKGFVSFQTSQGMTSRELWRVSVDGSFLGHAADVDTAWAMVHHHIG